MIAGKYTIKDFFVNRQLRQVIVPEIQRDYVWPEKPLRGLLTSLLHGFEGFHAFQPNLQLADKELQDSFTAYQRRLAHSTSIGFIYAYSDAEFAGRYFLIDGQQRLTSVLLMLLALAHRNPELREEFRLIFYADKLLKFDYKVREASHDFLIEFVKYLLENSTENVEQQTWYYQATKTDVTIQSLLRNFRFLRQQFDKADFGTFVSKTDGEKAFFDYLTHYTEFYYFDTNLSEQGEDLYIYMNARGEQMQANENLKADLLGKLKDSEKAAWGRKWEEWQDFFWQHRSTGKANNPNADAGFNEFLACIDGLTAYLESSTSAKLGAEAPDKPLKDIEQYVECLQFLEREKKTFENGYSYHAWVEACWNEIWNIFNVERSSWRADSQGDKRRKALVWPVLHFMAQHENRAAAPADTFRVLRMHYLRYHNHHNTVANLVSETTERLGSNGVLHTNGPLDEENMKHALYAAVGLEPTKAYEAVIWEIEDHKFNLSGNGLGGTNLTHLVELSLTTSLRDLRRVRDKFFELLPPDSERESANYLALRNALLHYGPYYQRESPNYLSNYNCGDWRRTVRGRGDEERQKPLRQRAFRCLFDAFLTEDLSLEEFIAKQFPTPLDQNAAQALHQRVLWYSQQLGTGLWRYGPYIFHTDWDGDDPKFPGYPVLYNSWGDRRSAHAPLHDMLPSTIVG